MLGDTVKGYGLWRILICETSGVNTQIDSTRIAFEAEDVGLLNKSMVLNALNRSDNRSPSTLATGFLRYGSSAISTAIASRALSISAQGAGMIGAGTILGLEIMGAFSKSRERVFDFSLINEGEINVPAFKCVETLSFAKLQPKPKVHRITVNLGRKLAASSDFRDSGLSSIPMEVGF